MAKRKSARPKRSAKSTSRAKSKKKTKPANTNKTIGILHSGTAGPYNNKSIKAFLDQLASAGYKVNQNLTIDPNTLWCNDDPGLLKNNAATLAGKAGLDLIVA